MNAEHLRKIVALNAPIPDPVRAPRYREIVAFVCDRRADPQALFAGLPAAVAAALGGFGFSWNGFYVLGAGGALDLGYAAGPPVCTPLPPGAELFAAGMCHDCLRLGFTLSAFDVREYPGYVSCDPESGLRTVGSIVVPIRSANREPIGVWDCDVTAPIDHADVRFFDVLFGALCALVEVRREHLGPGAR